MKRAHVTLHLTLRGFVQANHSIPQNHVIEVNAQLISYGRNIGKLEKSSIKNI